MINKYYCSNYVKELNNQNITYQQIYYSDDEMVTTLYVMKLNKLRVNMEEHYSDLHNTPLPVFSKHLTRKMKCRVCLQDGEMPMTSVASPTSEMKEALNIFADIGFSDNDEHQTYYILCYVCYKFLKSAILFRKVAQRTNETLKKSYLPEPFKQSPIQQTLNNDNFQDYENDKPDHINSTQEDEELEEENTKITCPTCHKVINKSYYKKHLNLHDPDFPAQYVCDICGKAYKFKNVYNRHKERHGTEYIFKCELCPYAGRYKERLLMHMRVHTGELKFLCTHCPARYISKGSLSDHIKLKHTEPQYKCDSCDKAYHNNLNLQRHIDAAHLGIRNHQCSICGKTFNYRKKMLDHQRKIHKMIGLRPNVKRIHKKPIT